MDELKNIAGNEVEIIIKGHKIIIREVLMKDLSAFAAVCSPFLSAFDEAGELSQQASSGAAPDEFALFKVLASNSDAFIKAAALVSNASVEFYEKLRPDEFFEVAAKVVEVNGSFFIRALMPSLVRLVQGVLEVGALGVQSTAGMTVSSGWLAEDTATAYLS